MRWPRRWICRRGPGQLTIECFDISHTAGEATAGLVRGVPPPQDADQRVPPLQDRGHHRRRRLRRHAPGAARAATARWPRPSARPDDGAGRCREPRRRPRLPDLVLVDGGKGQVGMAREVFAELGLDVSRIVGVEKGEGRKVGWKSWCLPMGAPRSTWAHDSAALMLVAQIRDEAHRFAITGMRAAARQGAHRRQAAGRYCRAWAPRSRARLLQRFGGVRGVADGQRGGFDDGGRHFAATLARREVYRALR